MGMGTEGIEPPTRGFSVRTHHHLSSGEVLRVLALNELHLSLLLTAP